RGPAPVLPDEVTTPELIASLLADGDDELAAWAIGQALRERPRAAVFDDVVRRAMELVGVRWATNQWTISQEHLASVALASALARLRPLDDPATRIGPVAVLAGPEGEQHVAGLACLAQVLEADGWQVYNLGANVPADDLVRFVSERPADLVALSVATSARTPALLRTVDALRASPIAQGGRRPTILVGGHGAAELVGQIAGADLVATTLAQAEAFARELAARRDVSPR
ncbi:MAG: hypothetical protein FJ038_14120, partial [Chloroflexi bacterium]|nr:hypothetical protein [Chloroflexota bacterium]